MERDLAVQGLYVFSDGVSSLRYLGNATLQKGSASISSWLQFTDTAGLLHVYQIKILKHQKISAGLKTKQKWVF